MEMKKIKIWTILFLTLPCLVFADNNIKRERVQFDNGSSKAIIEGSIKGDNTIDYLVKAKEGQDLRVSMKTGNGANYFNILAPGEDFVGFFNGSTADVLNQYVGKVPASGDLKIRVYLMRSAARRNESARFKLEIAISGNGLAGSASPNDALVAGTAFHATGEIDCKMKAEDGNSKCAFGVTRGDNLDGMVTISKGDGSKRVVFFEKGSATGYDKSSADSGDFRTERMEDNTIVHIGSEFYVIPDAVVSGG